MICQEEGCACFHHRLLECMERGLNEEAQLLLRRIENLCDATDVFGKTLLHYSVQYGNAVMVEHLINEIHIVNAQDHSGITPLMFAVNVESAAIVEILLKNNADIYITDSKGVSALQRSLYINIDLLRLDDAAKLFHYPYQRKENQRLILEMLIEKVNKDFLTEKEATVNLLSNVNCIVHLIVVACCNNELALFIMEYYFSIEFREPVLGLTALHCASALGKLENVKLLIERGLNVETVAEDGVTSLMLAVKNGNVAVVDTLLKNNAEIFVTDSSENGVSTLQRSFYVCVDLLKSIYKPQSSCYLFEAKKTHLLIMDIITEKVNEIFLTHIETMMKLLLNASCIVKLAIVVACNVELALFTLESDYPIDFCEPELGLTALHCAVMMGKLGNVKSLIERGANINSLDKKGYSPLHYYTIRLQHVDEKSEVLKHFLKSSTNLYVQDDDEATDIKYLIQRGTKKTVSAVLQSDVDIDGALGTWSLQWLLLGNKHLDIHDIINLGVIIDANLLNPRTTQSALVIEVYRKNARTVEFLLEHGANVNYSTDRWNPALFYGSVYSTRAKALFEITELLLIYGADAQVICNDGTPLASDIIRRHPQKEMRNLFVAHLAMLAAVDKSALTEDTRKSINSNILAKNHFDACSKQLEGLKDIALCGIWTLYDLLHVKEQMLIGYARNKELRKSCETPITISLLESYYVNKLQKRLTKAIGRVIFEEKVARIIEALTGFGVDIYHGIVYKIISYLDFQELNDLHQVDEIINVCYSNNVPSV